MKPLRLALLLPSGMLFGCLAWPQTDRRVEADMDFARGLATRFAYVDLAEEILADLEQRKLSGTQAEGLGLLKCEVYAAGAKGERKAENRLPLYDKALEAYLSFLSKNEYSDYLPDAQRSYVDLVNNYGRILEMTMADQVGPEREATREKIKQVIDAGLELTGNLIDGTANATTRTAKNERWRLMLNRGQMLLTLANVSEDGTFLYGRAESTLEDLALEAGEHSGPGLNAYLLLARVKLAQGESQSAADFATFVYDTVLPLDEKAREEHGWKEMPYEDKVMRWKLGELALDACVEALLGLGNVEQAARYALGFYGDYRREGFEISALGNLSLLSCAKAMLEAGGGVGVEGATPAEQRYRWFDSVDAMENAGYRVGARGTNRGQSSVDLALSIAQAVNDANKGNSLQVLAQKVISQIIERPGVEVDPEILFQAAQGDLFSRDFPQAVQSFKGILGQLDDRDTATRQEHSPRVLYHLGRSLEGMGRNLEASMTFREAATRWAGDPEYDQKVADGYYNAIRRAKATAGGDPMLENLYLEAENLLKALDAGGGAIAFRQAERAYNKQDYTEARTLYQQVEEGTEDYEKALVKAALCLLKQKDEVGARKELEDYLQNYVNDPRTKPVDARKIRARAEAMAQATYYAGVIAYQANEWDRVIAYCENYAKEYPDQDSYAPTALYLAAKSYLAKLDVASAERLLAELNETFATNPSTGNTAYAIFEALKADQEKAAAAGDGAKAVALASKMAGNLSLFNELSSKPNYSAMRQESTLWIELAEWQRAEKILRRITEVFPNETDLEPHVLPDLGLALLELKRVPEAFAVLDPLIPKSDADTRKPSAATVTHWCRSVTGWLEGDEPPVEIPGMGGAKELESACSYLRKLTDLEGNKDKYTGPWYTLKFDTAYGYYQWGKEDSGQTANAKALIENLQHIVDSTRLDPITAANDGDDTLRKRFLWLLERVK